jgi:all-trans-retinol 13,14-reductase
VLAAQSGNYGTAPVDVTVSAHLGMLDHYLRGAAYPAGGGQVVVAALVEALEAHGGALFTRSAVQRVLVADGAVTGVRLADGSTHTAPVVVSNADYRRTVLDLVGPEHFPAALVRKTREARMRLGFSVLYVALDTELPRERNANLWWFRDDDIEAMYRDIDQDPVPDEVPFLFCSFASTKQPGPGICPPGHSNFQVMTLSRADPERWGLARGPADGGRYRREPAYLRHKQRTTNALLRAAEAALGPFREHVTHLETATPVTHERYTASTGGTPYGLANWGGLGARPDTRTPVAGLYVTGANTRTGSGVAGAVLGGLTCAGHVLGRPLLSEVLDGAVLADPHLLAARPPGWDALRVSRGRARRDAKGLAGVG